MKEVELHTINDYLELIKKSKEQHLGVENITDFVFRGQPGDHPLIPKICRLKPKGDIQQVERLLLQEFKRSNPLLIEQHHPLDDWDYLTLGQHFGLPTRLLDWSNNALTALWFATQNNDPANVNDYSIIWILMVSDEDAIELGSVHPFDVPETKIIRPRIIKQRINNQSGVFSIYSTKDVVEKRFMNDSSFFSRKLIKVKIPATRHEDIRTDLNVLGINAFTIFPELEGLCSFLQWRYFE